MKLGKRTTHLGIQESLQCATITETAECVDTLRDSLKEYWMHIWFSPSLYFSISPLLYHTMKNMQVCMSRPHSDCTQSSSILIPVHVWGFRCVCMVYASGPRRTIIQIRDNILIKWRHHQYCTSCCVLSDYQYAWGRKENKHIMLCGWMTNEDYWFQGKMKRVLFDLVVERNWMQNKHTWMESDRWREGESYLEGCSSAPAHLLMVSDSAAWRQKNTADFSHFLKGWYGFFKRNTFCLEKGFPWHTTLITL